MIWYKIFVWERQSVLVYKRVVAAMCYESILTRFCSFWTFSSSILAMKHRPIEHRAKPATPTRLVGRICKLCIRDSCVLSVKHGKLAAFCGTRASCSGFSPTVDMDQLEIDAPGSGSPHSFRMQLIVSKMFHCFVSYFRVYIGVSCFGIFVR